MTDNKDALEQRLEFKREPRYIVFKIKDLKAFCNASLQQEIFRAGEVISHGRDIEGKPIFNAVVVEQDWPEFEPTWAAIEARMIGKPPPLEQVLQQLQQLQTVEAERDGLLRGCPDHNHRPKATRGYPCAHCLEEAWNDLAASQARCAAIVNKLKLVAYHRECEDPWYSCPMSEGGCLDDSRKGCHCGAEAIQEAIALSTPSDTSALDAVLAAHEEKVRESVEDAVLEGGWYIPFSDRGSITQWVGFPALQDIIRGRHAQED